jgi:arylsulfatase A-like enzyme
MSEIAVEEGCLMNRRNFLKAVGLAAASVAVPGCSKVGQGRGKRGKRPNILYIMSDDHACNAISCYGGILSKVARTPNIDRIAAEGVRLENCFVTNSICTPSRAAILTGQYSHVNGVYTLRDKIDPKRQNVAKLLQQGGYQTAVVGKWHLKTDPTGFDYWNVLPGQGRYHNPQLKEEGWQEKGLKTYEGRHSTDVITDLSLEWLRGCDKEKPFFLMCHFKAPHRAWQPAKRFADLYKDMQMPEPANLLDDYKNRSRAAANAKLMIGKDTRKSDVKREIPKDLGRDELRKWAYQYYIKDYLRCIAGVDENVGRLLKFLDEQGLSRDTVVVYTSDQGFFLGEHGYYDKRFMYEESLRMPFLARFPREIRPGSVNDDVVVNVDFAPTFLDYAALGAPSDMQGESFRVNLAGKTPSNWRKSMYYRYWMHLSHHGVPAHYGVRTKRYKLIFYYGLPLGKAGAVEKPTPPEWELFDLKKDPQEMNNVYHEAAYGEVRRELTAELMRLKRELGDTDEANVEMMGILKKL